MTAAAERDTPWGQQLSQRARRLRGRKRAHLLAMNEDVDAASKAIVYPAHGSLEMGAEVGGCAVEDVEAIALELVALCGVRLDGGEPGRVEDLDEGLDAVRGQEGGVEDGGEGAEVERAGVLLGGRGEDEVHGRAHGLHDLGGKAVEADHRGLWRGRGRVRRWWGALDGECGLVARRVRGR